VLGEQDIYAEGVPGVKPYLSHAATVLLPTPEVGLSYIANHPDSHLLGPGSILLTCSFKNIIAT
jgi:hypothetical protein